MVTTVVVWLISGLASPCVDMCMVPTKVDIEHKLMQLIPPDSSKNKIISRQWLAVYAFVFMIPFRHIEMIQAV